jgi:hypothetical protein
MEIQIGEKTYELPTIDEWDLNEWRAAKKIAPDIPPAEMVKRILACDPDAIMAFLLIGARRTDPTVTEATFGPVKFAELLDSFAEGLVGETTSAEEDDEPVPPEKSAVEETPANGPSGNGASSDEKDSTPSSETTPVPTGLPSWE